MVLRAPQPKKHDFENKNHGEMWFRKSKPLKTIPRTLVTEMKWRTEWSGRSSLGHQSALYQKKVFAVVSDGCCTKCQAPPTFLISIPTQEKRWQSSRYSRMSFRSIKNHPPFLTFLHPLVKRLNSDRNPIKSILSFFCGYPFWAGQTLENQ